MRAVVVGVPSLRTRRLHLLATVLGVLLPLALTTGLRRSINASSSSAPTTARRLKEVDVAAVALTASSDLDCAPPVAG